jgi:hypothetical protein
MGLDHELLTYRYAGRDFRLTGVAGVVCQDFFAYASEASRPSPPAQQDVSQQDAKIAKKKFWNSFAIFASFCKRPPPSLFSLRGSSASLCANACKKIVFSANPKF